MNVGPCHYCKRPGHLYATCRRRLNQCLRCGKGGHYIANCPAPQRSAVSPKSRSNGNGQGAIPKVRRDSHQRTASRSSSSGSDTSGSQKRQYKYGKNRKSHRDSERGVSSLNIVPLV